MNGIELGDVQDIFIIVLNIVWVVVCDVVIVVTDDLVAVGVFVIFIPCPQIYVVAVFVFVRF